MTRLRGEHEVALTAQRNEHQAAMNAALTAAVASRADGTGRPDAADWNAYCDSAPGTLIFNLRHRFENRAAIMAFSQLRCTVTDPAGVRTEAVGTGLFVQYLPYYFPDAPPVRDGTYAFAWDGLDAKGRWQRIKEGTCEVTGSPAGDAEAIGPGDA